MRTNWIGVTWMIVGWLAIYVKWWLKCRCRYRGPGPWQAYCHRVERGYRRPSWSSRALRQMPYIMPATRACSILQLIKKTIPTNSDRPPAEVLEVVRKALLALPLTLEFLEF